MTELTPQAQTITYVRGFLNMSIEDAQEKLKMNKKCNFIASIESGELSLSDRECLHLIRLLMR